MEELYDRLAVGKEAGTLDPEAEKLARKFFETLALLASNPRHNSLERHEIDALTRRVGFKVFQSYLENRNPSAGRLFWAYGPARGQIAVLGLEPHPEDTVRGYAGFASLRFRRTRRVEENALVGYNSRLGISRADPIRPSWRSPVAGHSKWKQIKRKKAITDNKRAANWTKLIREITVAARAGGGDPAGNPRLRLAIDTARAANMPNENIDRAIKKGTGELEGVNYEEITYEAYGPGGVAIMIESLTDNGNRTVADIRRWLTRNGGNLGTTGSVAWMFDRRGQIVVDGERHDEDTVMEAALEAGALDVESEEGAYTVLTEVADFTAVQDGLREKGIGWESAELAMVPKTMVNIAGPDADQLMKLLELIEDLDDVQKVYTNADVDVDSLAEV